MITTEYFKEYRQKIGFSNQNGLKVFFGAKDIIPPIDLEYIRLLNKRLIEIVEKINSAVHRDIKVSNLQEFNNEFIEEAFKIIKKNKIIPRLNNLGRRPEEVYFSWMRGFVTAKLFEKALSVIFSINTSNIHTIGNDDLKNIDVFKKTPTADIEIEYEDQKIRVEIQSGFTGINDIKQHKVLEARKIYREQNIHTIAIHFDLFDGQVALVQLDNIDDNNINWITRQQMEGQTVFNIEQNYFIWKLTEVPVSFKNLEMF